jgi:hypothetical protein
VAGRSGIARNSVDRHRGKNQPQAPVLATAPTADLAARIGGRISAFGPDIVITHSGYGDYGHADHAATHRATVRAFEAFADKHSRLYALAWSKFLVRLNSRLMKLGGRDIRHMGPDGRFDLSRGISLAFSGTSSSSVKGGNVISVGVADMLTIRRTASRWYVAEISRGPLPLRILEKLPVWLQRTVLGKARLRLVRGPHGFTPGESRKSGSATVGFL